MDQGSSGSMIRSILIRLTRKKKATSYKLQASSNKRLDIAAGILQDEFMKDKTLIVKKKNIYGNELIYPVCQDSIIFSYIAGSKTFCSITIANIKKLGYKFETQKEEI